MTGSQILFYLISAFILSMGVLSVTTRKIFRSAIWLLFSLVGIAGLYFWMDVQFIAAVQIVVYVGGIVVLIIISILLTQQSGKEMPKAPLVLTIASVLSVLFGYAFTYLLIDQYGFVTIDQPFDNDVARIGNAMLNTQQNGYSLPFEVVIMLLLAAMVGCIVIALKAPSKSPPKEET